MNPAVQVAIESDGGVGYRDLPNQSRTAAGTILMRNLFEQRRPVMIVGGEMSQSKVCPLSSRLNISI